MRPLQKRARCCVHLSEACVVINERLTRVVGRFRAFVPTPLSGQGLLFARRRQLFGGGLGAIGEPDRGSAGDARWLTGE
jgi:hypothetical protein